jgi:hypothetical protein
MPASVVTKLKGYGNALPSIVTVTPGRGRLSASTTFPITEPSNLCCAETNIKQIKKRQTKMEKSTNRLIGFLLKKKAAEVHWDTRQPLFVPVSCLNFS